MHEMKTIQSFYKQFNPAGHKSQNNMVTAGLQHSKGVGGRNNSAQ